ncbi:MAG: DUF4249 family protein [Candidatus Marinimicrobia bacterium]|jgi:hypothetical protein|nr:DUF4249 family protein [Candidatus Neomarinimicrobiota bacterium]MBT3961538.1 DUF4249 family protein [Candidatus Neomarinimicrobiota bacterium]MBT4382074.1 DUF4249 family protein [Candidatus Neomarinimicrobiota bacterium]MBT4636071.1 DUF4249 family protein [Candidatus Neomarinimicrobiota bacterium]MBT4685911.1 DUF4249 family protein [Candidatus Neomarinimicrobiota bacterium]
MKHLLIISFLFIVSCEGWGWQTVESDHESTLNVFGLIVSELDTSYGFVYVYQSLNLQDQENILISSDTIFYGPGPNDYYTNNIYQSGYTILDANVTISSQENEWNFTYVSEGDWGIYESKYVDTSGTFNPQPGETYSLLVEAGDERIVQGTVTVPLRPNIREEFVPDSLSNRSPYSISFDAVEDEGTFRLITNAIFGYYACGTENRHLITDPTDTVWTSQVTDCSDSWWGDDEYDDSIQLEVKLESMDSQYYDYFLEHGNKNEFISFIMGSEGATGRSFGVEGGFGVFGAIATDKIERIFVP